MGSRITQEEAIARREGILGAARWCFLNFGFSKTSFDDISKRANISRTLLYKSFRNKEDIYTAVFAHWLVARHPVALNAAAGPGSAYERLIEVCRVLVVEPWNDMVGAPMASKFYDACERLDPAIVARHREVAIQCLTRILVDETAAEVLFFALNGLLDDKPTTEVLERRVQLLAARFAPPKNTTKALTAPQSKIAQQPAYDHRKGR